MIVIKEEGCKGCRYCVLSCPRGLIQVDEGVINAMGYNPVIFTNNPDNPCSGCALCAEVCPDVLIEVYREKGGGNSR
ncbi:MAG: 4Fe-4S dicluster domain-containing protein [Dethiobacteria bacterium]|jgi:2-oxoglutarate ferredoxin oxidoreductase subunit delta